MEGLLDRASPRRGSLTSLHRYPSGNLSHNAKQSSPSSTLQINSPNLSALCKDLDKFTRYFIVKAVQVIVQSRLNGGRKIKTDCKPNGNDWFNLNISDIVEVSDKTKSILDSEGLSVKANWRFCCEISLRINDGSRVVLEHWIISNKSNFNSSQKLSNDIAHPKGYPISKTSAIHAASNSVRNSNGASLMGIDSSGKARTATLSSSSRLRLNSIDDGDNRGLASDRYLSGNRYDNLDIKPSTSCFTLSNTPAANQHTNEVNPISESPSKTSLSANPTAPSHPFIATKDQQQQLANSNQATNNSSTSLQSQSYANKSSATSSSIYTTYNKMSLLLKAILTTAHIVPAYRSASRGSQSDSCVICYRVYAVPRLNPPTKGSIEDIGPNHLDSPNRRSQTSISSLGSIDMREFVAFDELDFFCPVFKLGSVKTDINELEVSLCYRTDTRGSSNSLRSPLTRDLYNRFQDEDCLIAAKQLLAGNTVAAGFGAQQENRNKNGSCNSLDRDKFSLIDEPLKPAFANNKSVEITQVERTHTDEADDCALIESAFDRLLENKVSTKEKGDEIVTIANEAIRSPLKNGRSVNSNKANDALRSEPIQVPDKANKLNNLISTPGSTPKSLSDSYVFVELNPPFASDEQNDLNSFFHGPTPSFANSPGSLKNVDDLTTQLANIEANASQIDDFVDNICISEDDEECENSINP